MEKWKFEFTVTGISEGTADLLLREFIGLVSASGGTLAGGFLPQSSSEGEAEVPDVQKDAE